LKVEIYSVFCSENQLGAALPIQARVIVVVAVVVVGVVVVWLLIVVFVCCAM
jgi:hypothetical protein